MTSNTRERFEEKFNIQWGIEHSAGDYGLDMPGTEELLSFIEAEKAMAVEEERKIVLKWVKKNKYEPIDSYSSPDDGKGIVSVGEITKFLSSNNNQSHE